MRLYLVQHGEALPKEEDPDRHLSKKGHRDSDALGQWLRRSSVSVHAILHSGKTRARQTAESLVPVLSAGGEIREGEGLGPNDSPQAFLDTLSNTEDGILVASHMPFVARVVSVALTGAPDHCPVEFEPGSVAGLCRADGERWSLFLFAGPEFFR